MDFLEFKKKILAIFLYICGSLFQIKLILKCLN